MEQLMQANLQIMDLLGAVFEEVERQGSRAATSRPGRPSRPRTWVGRSPPGHDRHEPDMTGSRTTGMN